MFDSILIANRGEIAVRVARTARRLGLRVIAVYSEADAGAPHVAMADEAVCIGPPAAATSYLNADAVLRAARDSGAACIHPGYGFLSENAEFARACAREGLVFVGPPAAAMEAMGLKSRAKQLMQEAGVPVVPGYHGADQDDATLGEAALKIGFPVLIKPSAGGGGKGMRRVDDVSELGADLAAARREALSSFGDSTLLIEKYIETPRHIEIQVLGDNHGNVVHLFERDCSAQRRHQKIIEEAPAPGLDEEVRAAMCEAAVKAARAVNYSGAGTVEFIADGSKPLSRDGFWFLEMNTRLQVEHPVTEMITGLDLVEWQLRVAAGETLPSRLSSLKPDGHAIEARLYAEDPANGFLPSVGRVHRLDFAMDAAEDPEAVRIDAGIAEGGEVTPYYDPMIAKLIAHGKTRRQAIERLDALIANSLIAGPKTNALFLRRLITHREFRRGGIDTGFVARNLDALTRVEEGVRAGLIAAGLHFELDRAGDFSFDASPWDAADGWQLGGQRRIGIDAVVDGAPVAMLATWRGGDCEIAPAEGPPSAPPDDIRLVEAPGGVYAASGGLCLFTALDDPLSADHDSEAGQGDLTAPMPGRVAVLNVVKGDKVRQGDTLLVLEAMKMEHAIKAPFAGVVSALAAAEGEQVGEGAVLVHLEPEAE